MKKEYVKCSMRLFWNWTFGKWDIATSLMKGATTGISLMLGAIPAILIIAITSSFLWVLILYFWVWLAVNAAMAFATVHFETVHFKL